MKKNVMLGLGIAAAGAVLLMIGRRAGTIGTSSVTGQAGGAMMIKSGERVPEAPAWDDWRAAYDGAPPAEKSRIVTRERNYRNATGTAMQSRRVINGVPVPYTGGDYIIGHPNKPGLQNLAGYIERGFKFCDQVPGWDVRFGNCTADTAKQRDRAMFEDYARRFNMPLNW